MDEKKRFVLTIFGGLVGLFFLTTRFFIPIVKNNAQRLAEYRQLKTEVGTIEKFTQSQLSSLQEKIDAAILGLEKKFPAEGKLRFMEQLTQIPKGSKIVFTEIVRREPWKEQEYWVLPVDVNMKASFYDLIKYLAQIEASPLMIGIDSLSLRKIEPEGLESLDIRITFSGFSLTKEFPSMSEYLQERYKPLNRQELEKLLEPVKLKDSQKAVSELRAYNPFVYGFKGSLLLTEPGVTGIENLFLKGILRLGDERAALINDTVVKEGENIAGMQVLEIREYEVILTWSGKNYILKMGVDDESIKP